MNFRYVFAFRFVDDVIAALADIDSVFDVAGKAVRLFGTVSLLFFGLIG